MMMTTITTPRATLEILQSEQKELLSRVTPDDFTVWLASPLTKGLVFLHMQIDSEDLKALWASDSFDKKSSEQAIGQVKYIEGFVDYLRERYKDEY